MDREVLAREVRKVRTDAPFVSEMAFAFPTKKKIVLLRSCNIAGYGMPSGILVTSKKVAA